MSVKKYLSIFIDESGDFGEPCEHCPYFIFTLVFHDQSACISDMVQAFNRHLAYEGFDNHVIHTGPLIRREDYYKDMLLEDRQKLFKHFFYFTRKLPIKYQTFKYQKAIYQEPYSLSTCIARELGTFIDCNRSYFNTFDKYIIYYDNGQHELNKILTTVFSVIFHTLEFRNALQCDYRLSQVADLICTLELLRKKLENNCLTKSDSNFFTRKELKKTYFSGVNKLRFLDC